MEKEIVSFQVQYIFEEHIDYIPQSTEGEYALIVNQKDSKHNGLYYNDRKSWIKQLLRRDIIYLIYLIEDMKFYTLEHLNVNGVLECVIIRISKPIHTPNLILKHILTDNNEYKIRSPVKSFAVICKHMIENFEEFEKAIINDLKYSFRVDCHIIKDKFTYDKYEYLIQTYPGLSELEGKNDNDILNDIESVINRFFK